MLRKAPMPVKKFDFSICCVNGFIYVLAGKAGDGDGRVVSSCERFEIAENRWEKIAPCCKKRYASTAVGTRSGLIFLFGGRCQVENQMVSLIERYDIAADKWTVVQIRGEIP